MTGVERLRRQFGAHTPGLLGARHSYAVLCPLVEQEDGLHLLYEVRAKTLHRQPGEVCFPGGRVEAGEQTDACALRETEEELSISRREIEILGHPDFICNQAGFLMQPVLGLISPAGMEAMSPSPAEVAETFTVPLSFFFRHPPEIFTYRLLPEIPADFPYEAVGIPDNYPWAQGRVEIPIWHWQGHTIWGMTARLTMDIVNHL